MLLDETGLKIEAFDPVLAEALGSAQGDEGHNIVTEAGVHMHSRIQLRDWLYCLAKTPGTLVRRGLIDPKGRSPEVFIDGVEGAMDDDEDEAATPPDKMTSATVAPAVMKMLETAERLMEKNGSGRITDAVLTQSLLDSADEYLLVLLGSWASEDGMKAFVAHVRSQVRPAPETDIFNSDGRLNMKLFTSTGRTFCQRLREDAQSLGAKRITTRHLLYALLADETGLLSLALAMNGAEVKKELHAALSRELVRPGVKRNSDFELTRESMFEAVAQALKEALKQAYNDDRTVIAEFDISRAFALRQPAEIARLTSGGKPVAAAAVRAYVESAQRPEEDEEEPLRRFTISEIEDNINKRIRGQKAAVSRVIPWVKRLRFGVPRQERPAAVVLFLGPTGTGKTQLAKELARYVYGDEQALIHVDMGQFKTRESINMFIGAPPGYVGYGDGQLTNGLRDKPESVVLFDEIEKADIQVFDALMRFADEGLIRDPAGPVRDGRKCIIVLTTNAGQQWLRGYFAENPGARENPETITAQLFQEAMKELQEKNFRPEFLGRVDERIVFLPLTLAVCREIIDGVLERELDPYATQRGVSVEVDDDVRNVLAQRVYERSADEGARGAPRAVNEFIIAPMIDLLAEEEDKGSFPTHVIAFRTGISNIKVKPK